MAGLLLAAAAGIAIESAREIATPHHAPAPWTLPFLLGVVVSKEALFRRLDRRGDEARSAAVRADAWHHRSDALSSLAAAVGIAVALAGGPGWEAADDWAALFCAAVIARNAVRIARSPIDEVMDAAVGPAVVGTVRAAAASVAGVRGSDSCLVRKAGLRFYVDLHIAVDGSLPVREGHRIAHEVKAAVRAAVPDVADVLVHVEPADGKARE